MFKLPTWAELRGLFFSPTKLAHAIKGIETAAVNAERVAVHNTKRAAARFFDAAMHHEAASNAEDKADAHTAEADRAARVAGRLSELVA